jgi:alkylhydroperoxidase family enzyme
MNIITLSGLLQEKAIGHNHSIDGIPLPTRRMTMTKFELYSVDTAPEGSRAKLAEVTKAWGFTPKLHSMLAESPVALKAYDQLFALVGESTMTPIEQQVAYQAINVFHECEYCTAGHTFLSRNADVPEDAIQALRNQTPIADARLQALRLFAEAVVRERGFASDDAIDAFIRAGFTRANILEIVTIIATKTISNYTNHLTKTPKEDFMADPSLGWVAPRNRAKAA